MIIDIFFIFLLICFMKATSILIVGNSVVKHIHLWGGFQDLWLLQLGIQATQYALSVASCYTLQLLTIKKMLPATKDTWNIKQINSKNSTKNNLFSNLFTETLSLLRNLYQEC